MNVTEKVKTAIMPLFENSDIKLIDVEYTKKVDGMHLIVYIDKLDGITVEDCSEISHKIDPILDSLDPTNNATYIFDVSSWGLDKPLKFDHQLDKYIDKQVSVTLYMKVDNLKKFDAKLKSYDKDGYEFEVNDKIVRVERKQVATILPFLDF